MGANKAVITQIPWKDPQSSGVGWIRRFLSVWVVRIELSSWVWRSVSVLDVQDWDIMESRKFPMGVDSILLNKGNFRSNFEFKVSPVSPAVDVVLSGTPCCPTFIEVSCTRGSLVQWI